jgi:hypothetical protein
MANLLDLGAVFGEKIRGRFVQSAMISKELQSKLSTHNKNQQLTFFSGHCSSTQGRGTEAQNGSRKTPITSL